MTKKNDVKPEVKEVKEETEGVLFKFRNDRINKLWECYTLNDNKLWIYMTENIWSKVKN